MSRVYFCALKPFNRLWLVLFAAAVEMLFQSAKSHAAEVEVAEVAWTTAVADLQFTNRYPEGSTAPLAPIYLWTRMKASQAALDQLRAAGKLPIRHNWIHFVGVDVDMTSLKPLDQIDLGVGTQALVPQLEREVSDRGWFDWRTWSGKEHIEPGKWEVDIVYQDGEPVLCQNPRTNRREPCRFFIALDRLPGGEVGSR